MSGGTVKWPEGANWNGEDPIIGYADADGKVVEVTARLAKAPRASDGIDRICYELRARVLPPNA